MAVQSAFGRRGPHVAAKVGDYSAALINNDSEVEGDTLADANVALLELADTKATLAGDLGGSTVAPEVVAIRGYAVADSAPNDGDRLVWSQANSQWEPQAPPPAFNSTWDTIYEKDLRTLPTGPWYNQGSYVDATIDEQPWWFHFSHLEGVQLAHGQGFVMSGKQPPSSGNNYAGTYAGLRVYQMPAYDPAKHVAVQFRMSGAAVSGNYWGTRMYSGGSGFGGPAHSATTLALQLGASNSSTIRFMNSNFSLNYAASLQGPIDPPDVSQYVIAVAATPWGASGAVKDKQWRTHYFQRDVLGTAMPRMEDMQQFGASNDTGTAEGPNYRIGAFVSHVNNGALVTLRMTHVRVLQKAVATL